MPRRCAAALLYLILIGSVLLGGCAVTPQQPSVSGAPDLALQKQLQSLQHWTMNGKLAVKTAGDAYSAHLVWQQQDDGFDIRLSGPAGLKATHIYGMPGGVVFEQGDRTERAGSAKHLSEKLLGWPLPAAELVSWLRGLPAQSQPVEFASYSQEGRLMALQQADWHIRFSQYTRQGILFLPGRIEARRGDLLITLLAKQWTVGP